VPLIYAIYYADRAALTQAYRKMPVDLGRVIAVFCGKKPRRAAF